MLTLRLQNPSPLPPTGRIREIDELRGWAMVLVILYHTGGVLGWTNWLHGETGVDVFLLISGFTLVRSSRDLGWSAFLRRRLVRIYPAYWIALALFLFLNARFYGSPRSLGDILWHIAGLHGFACYDKSIFSDINDSFWFISLILAMYVVFIFIRRRLADLSWVLGVGLLLTVAAGYYYILWDHAGGLSHLSGRVLSFFLGLVAGQVALEPVSVFKLEPVFIAGMIAMTWIGWTRGFFPFGVLAGPAMILVFFVLRNSLRKHPDGRFALGGLATVGVYSYEIFLFHQPLIRDYNALIWAHILGVETPARWQLGLGVIAMLVVTFGLSVLVHHLCNALLARLRQHPSPSTHDRAVA